jgi:hypothetical protein
MSRIGDLLKAGISSDGVNVRIFQYGGQLAASGPMIEKKTATTEGTVGAVTFSISVLLGKLILRDPKGANRADKVPTAANIVGGIKDCKVGDSFEFIIRNTADGNEVITLTTNTGVTLSGVMTIGRGQARRFIAVVTNASSGSEAVSVYDAGLQDNTYLVPVEVDDVGTAASSYAVAPYTGKVVRVYSIIHASLLGADAVLTLATSVGDITETITITQSGSAAGDIDVVTPADHANVVVAAGSLLKVTSDGGPSNAVRATVMFEIVKT